MNIKQLFLSAIFFCVAIYIPLVTAYAQESASSASDSGLVQITTPTPADYQLPYPGMLPDNPLYFLKAIRDAITALFLSKPLDKATFDLQQSDKNIQASYLLISQQQGKTMLALQTFSQGQDDFDQAITQATSAKKQGYSTKDLATKLSEANQKHEQILEAIAQSAHQNSSQTIKNEHDRIQIFSKEIKSL
jgi:hypothetical protein